MEGAARASAELPPPTRISPPGAEAQGGTASRPRHRRSHSDTLPSKQPKPKPKPKHSARPAWRKVLYEQQPYEDNYVDQHFLSTLIKNQNVVIVPFWEVVKGTVSVTLQLSIVVLYNLVFWYTLDAPDAKAAAVELVVQHTETAEPLPAADELRAELEDLTLRQLKVRARDEGADGAAIDAVDTLTGSLQPEWSVSPAPLSPALDGTDPAVLGGRVLFLDVVLLVAGAAHISVMYDGFAPFAEQAFRRPSSLLQQPGPAAPGAAPYGAPEVLSLLGPPHDIAGICVAFFRECQQARCGQGAAG